MPSNAQAEQRRVIAWAATGMVGVFVAIAVLVRASGQPWSTAAGVAGLPTVFGGWYFGALLPLSRHDFSDAAQASPAPAIAVSATAVDPLPSAVRSLEIVDAASDADAAA